MPLTTQDTHSPSLAIETVKGTGVKAHATIQLELAARLGIVSFGVAAFVGLIATGLQKWQVLPLLFEAETFESRRLSEEAEVEMWAPEDGAERTSYTLLSNLAITWGFTLAFSAALLLYNRPVSAWAGAGLGMAGWVTFILSPCAGLSPELPGMAGAELLLRQEWWIGACIASVIGIGVAASGSSMARAVGCTPGVGLYVVRLAALLVGMVLLLVPHMVGAPHPTEGDDTGHASHRLLGAVVHRALSGDASDDMSAGPPLAMAAEFSVAVLLSTAVYWILLGVASAVGFTMAMGYPTVAQHTGTRAQSKTGSAPGYPASIRDPPLEVEKV